MWDRKQKRLQAGLDEDITMNPGVFEERGMPNFQGARGVT